MPKQILLADDSATIGKMVQITFAHEDAVVTCVRSGDEAVARARAQAPDILLLDAAMPGKSGYDTCAELRAAGLGDLPVFLLTGNFSPYDEAKGKAAGADGNVVKPFDTQALIDRVNQLVGQKGQGRSEAKPASVPPPPPAKSEPVAAAPPPPRPAPPPPVAPPRPPAPAVPPAMAAPKPPAKPSLPPRATLMGIPTVHPSSVAQLANLASPTFSPPSVPPKPPAASRSEERTVVEMEAPVLPPEPKSAPTVQSMAATPIERVAPMPAESIMPPPIVIPPLPVTAPPVAAPAAPVSSAATGKILRPSFIPNAPTPKARQGEESFGDFENSESTRRVENMVIPKQAHRESSLPPAVRERSGVMADTVAAVTREAIPRVADIIAAQASATNAGGHAAAASGKGAEYDAIAKLSREVIEQVVWEVVPDLAEQIIRAELDRLVKERQRA